MDPTTYGAPSRSLSEPLYSVARMRTTPASDGRTDCESQAVAARLRALRQRASITQADLALRLGTTQSAVARMEAGQPRMNLSAVRRVAEALGYDAELVIRERGTA